MFLYTGDPAVPDVIDERPARSGEPPAPAAEHREDEADGRAS